MLRFNILQNVFMPLASKCLIGFSRGLGLRHSAWNCTIKGVGVGSAWCPSSWPLLPPAVPFPGKTGLAGWNSEWFPLIKTNLVPDKGFECGPPPSILSTNPAEINRINIRKCDFQNPIPPSSEPAAPRGGHCRFSCALHDHQTRPAS